MNWPIFSGRFRVRNADNADSSSDRSIKTNLPAFDDRGIRIVQHQEWDCSYNETIVPKLIDAVKF
jgi:hypothetical protein